MQSIKGSIYSINISIKKGTIKKAISQCMVNYKGIYEDAHSGSWHRQISLLSIESINQFSIKNKREIEPGAFAENITTEGINLSKITIFDRFTIGKIELEVTQIGKKCHGDGCSIFYEIGKCIMPHNGIFCRVLNEGKMAIKDVITYFPICLRIAVVTISDRVSRGEYEDTSGPEIIKNVTQYFQDKAWKLFFYQATVSDDIDNIREEIENICRKNFDIILTTGGTGIGPRDNTYEVVKKILNKEMPGIMEYIRFKYGSIIPNNRISRSIAGTVKSTIIYTLPGSQKAVKEYCSEILPTLEHSLFMLRGINKH